MLKLTYAWQCIFRPLMKATNQTTKKQATKWGNRGNPASKQHPVEQLSRVEEEEEDGISLVRQGTSLATFASSDKLKTAKRENRNKPKSDGRARESFNCEKSHDLLQCGTVRLRVASATAATLAASGRKVAGGICRLSVALSRTFDIERKQTSTVSMITPGPQDWSSL